MVKGAIRAERPCRHRGAVAACDGLGRVDRATVVGGPAHVHAGRGFTVIVAHDDYDGSIESLAGSATLCVAGRDRDPAFPGRRGWHSCVVTSSYAQRSDDER